MTAQSMTFRTVTRAIALTTAVTAAPTADSNRSAPAPLPAPTAAEQSAPVRKLEALLTTLREGNATDRCGAARALGQLGDARATDQLINTLSDADPTVRNWAAWALRQVASQLTDVDRLARLCSTDDYQLRCAALRVLARIRDPRAIEPLIRTLSDRKWWVRASLAESIGGSSRRGIKLSVKGFKDQNRVITRLAGWALHETTKIVEDPDALITLLGVQHDAVHSTAASTLRRAAEASDDVDLLIRLTTVSAPVVRETAADSLGRLGAVRATEPLLGLLRDTSWEVRRSAIRALGQAGDVRAVAPLIAALEDEDRAVKESAAKALRSIAPRLDKTRPLLSMLEVKDPLIQCAAAEALGAVGDPHAVEPLIELWTAADVNVRSAVGRALSQLVAAVADIHLLIKVSNVDDLEVHASVVEALKQLDGDVALEPLVRALREGSGPVRSTAAEALGHVKSPHAVPHLVNALGDGDVWVRSSAAEAISRLARDMTDVGVLTSLVGVQHQDTRATAVARLDSIAATTEDAAVLVKLAAVEEPAVRASAAETMGRVDSARVIQPLTQLLDDANEDVRRRATTSLAAAAGRTTDVGVLVRLLDVDAPAIHSLVANRLLEMDVGKVVDALVRVLDDGSVRLRSRAAKVLAGTEAPRAVVPLIRALGDADRKVACSAATALGQIGGARAAAPLIQVLSTEREHVVHAATEALIRIGAPAVAPLIQAMAQDRDTGRARYHVCRVLERIAEGTRDVDVLAALLRVDNRRVRNAAADRLKVVGPPPSVAPR